MIKNLTIAAAFAGSMIVGASPAVASPSMCYAEFLAADAACGTDANCAVVALANLNECLDRYIIIHE